MKNSSFSVPMDPVRRRPGVAFNWGAVFAWLAVAFAGARLPILGGTVNNLGDNGAGSLRQVIQSAAPDETITFSPGVTGTIILTSGELAITRSVTIVGPGAGALAISGNHRSRVLRISADNGAVVISGLSIRDGFSAGAASANDEGGDAYGGGVYGNGFAPVRLERCVVSNNAVVGGTSGTLRGGSGFGGGIAGRVTLQDCVVSGNSATGGNGPLGPGGGLGGGLYGGVTLVGCTISDNTARGADNVRKLPGGQGWGGGIYGNETQLSNCVVSRNTARGGDGSNSSGGQGYGAGIYAFGGPVTLVATTVTANAAMGGDGSFDGDEGGEGAGGGIFGGVLSGSMTLLNCTVSSNSATGGLGQTPSGSGGQGNGGGIYSNTDFGALVMNNCTVTRNQAAGGMGGNAGIDDDDGTGTGGGIYNLAPLAITNCTISHNIATGGPGNDNGNRGGGLFHTSGTATLVGTIIANNVGVGSVSPDVRGTIATARFNLIGVGSSSLLGIVHDKNGNQVGTAAVPLDPKLGPLQKNGGFTLTRALLAGSTAIDRGITGVGVTDQRGRVRPYDDPSVPNAVGSDGSDIGAYESQPDSGPTSGPTLSIALAAGQVTVSWAPKTPGFILQEKADPSSGPWGNSPSVDANPVTVPATVPTRVYRLVKP